MSPWVSWEKRRGMILERHRRAYLAVAASPPRRPGRYSGRPQAFSSLPQRMDPSSTALSFAEGRALLPFWIALTTGAFLVCVAFIARPWPPRGSRLALIAAGTLLWLATLGYLLVERRLIIDPAARALSEAYQVLSLGPKRTWAFEDVSAVVLTRASDQRLHLGLEAAGERIAVRGYSDVLQAEQEALALAGFGGWKALRRGYRIDRQGQAGEPQRFRTAQGRQGVVFDFNDVVRVVEVPGSESVIEPLP